MLYMKMLEMLIKESVGKDKMLLQAEVNAFLKDQRVRKSLEKADFETREKLQRQLESLLGKQVDLDQYAMAEQI